MPIRFPEGYTNGSAPPVATGEVNVDERLKKKAYELVQEAKDWRDRRFGFLERRADAVNMYMGRFYEGSVQRDDGQYQTKKSLLADQGRREAIIEIVGPTVNQLQGQFRQNESERQIYPVGRNDTELAEMINVLRRRSRRENDAPAIEADGFLEWIVSGEQAFRSDMILDHTLGRWRVSETLVHPTNLFYNLDIQDRRGTGLRIIGEQHSMSMEAIYRKFSRSDADVVRLKKMYGASENTTSSGVGQFSRNNLFNIGSFHDSIGLPRVFEIHALEDEWQLWGYDPMVEVVAEAAMQGNVELASFEPLIPQGYGPVPNEERLNADRAFREIHGLPQVEVEEPRLAPVWHTWFMAPSGEIITHYPCPYWHQEHPYTLGMAFWLDGETRGLVQALESSQKWLVSLLVEIDHQMRTGPHGTVLYDKGMLDESDLKQKDVDDALARADVSLGVKLTGNKRLSDFFQHITSNSVSSAYMDMVPMLLELSQRSSGVNDAALGHQAKSGTPFALYEREVIQSALSTYVYTDTFMETLHLKDRKQVRLLQQNAQSPETLRDYQTGKEVQIDPRRLQAMQFDIAPGSAKNTATYRLANEQILREDMSFGLDYMTYLKLSGRPEAPKILEELQLQQQQLQAAQQGQLQ